MKNKINYIIFFILLLFAQCQDDLLIDIPEHESKLVVEGWIDQNFGARVLLTLSAPFFSEIDSTNLRDFAVTTAKVSISSSTEQEVLTLKPNDIYFPPYYYFGSLVRGNIKEEYTLKIEFRGITYYATTTIPSLTKPDSVWFERDQSDSLGLLLLSLNDNPGEKNYYRTLTKRKGIDERFIPTLNSIISDEQFNGETIEFSLSRGNTNLLDIDNNRYYSVGDTIILRFCSIDKEHFDFWKTFETQAMTSSNPFAVSNAEVHTNITGGIGVWGGYSVSYDTVIAK